MHRTSPAFPAGALAATALLAAPAADAEPFLVRNQHPVTALYGLPAPLPARLPAADGPQFAALANWSSFATDGTEGARGYTLDGEVFEARVRFGRALGERFALHGELAWRSLGAGTLDSTVEGWHDLFGLPNGARDRLPEDELLLEYRSGDGVPFRLREETSGLADVPVSLGYRLAESEAGALAGWFTVKLPVGRASDFTGSGALDVALTLAGERRLATQWQLFGQANVAWLGEGDLLPALQQDFAWSVLGGVTWDAWRSVELTMQVETNSAVLDTGLTAFDGGATVLTFGGSYRSPRGWRFDFGVSEDVQADASPDVVFNLGARRGF